MATNTAHSELTSAWEALGCPWRAATPSDSVDGIHPTLVCMPENVEQAARALEACNNARLAVLPRGSGTKIGLGNPPSAGDIVIETAGLNRVIDFMPDNLTVTVEAGTRLAALQEALAQERQFLPVDPPFSDRATIGGIVATNSSGPSRLLYGSMRDLIVGSQVALPDGRLARAGGRVVKNVAGYDLNKLWTGSLGTLALLTEFSFKLNPMPESEGTLLAAFASPQAAAAGISSIVRSIYGPAALDIIDSRAARILAQHLGRTDLGTDDQGALLAARGRGLRAVVQRQMVGLGEMAGSLGASGTTVLDEGNSAGFWAALANYRALVPQAVILKLATTLTRLESTFIRIRELLQTAALASSSVSHAGNGIIYLFFDSPENEAGYTTFADVVQQLRTHFSQSNSSVVIEHASLDLKQGIDVWGEPGGGAGMMRALKTQFDPHNIMNPGRFAAGI